MLRLFWDSCFADVDRNILLILDDVLHRLLVFISVMCN